MKIMTWNIRFGGLFGKTDHSDRILDYLQLQGDTDVFVLTEYQSHSAGLKIAATLHQSGWAYQVSSAPQAEEQGVLIASRLPLEPPPVPAVFPFGPHSTLLQHRVAVAHVVAHKLTVIGVYMPWAESEVKALFWQQVLAYARQCGERLVLAGDLNSCLAHDSEQGIALSASALHELRSMMTDAWEACNPESVTSRERFTWYDQQMGRRLDYIFVAPALPAIFAKHAHVAREQQVSDHSAVMVKLAL